MDWKELLPIIGLLAFAYPFYRIYRDLTKEKKHKKDFSTHGF